MKYNLIAIEKHLEIDYLRMLENYNHSGDKISLEGDDGLDIIDDCRYELYMNFMNDSADGIDFYTKNDLIFFYNSLDERILGALVPQTHYMYNAYLISDIIMDYKQRIENGRRLDLLVKLLLSLQ